MSTDDSMNLPGGASGTSSSPIQDRAKQDLGHATEHAKRDLDAIGQKAADEVANLKRQAGDQLHDATDKAKSFASEQKDLAAGQISGIASAINKVADELEGSDQQMVGRYARDLASGLSRFGNNVQSKNVDDLMGMAQNFGRSQPLAFLGAAALAGFVASRFAMASAHRRESGQYSGDQSNNYTGNSSAYGTGSTGGYASGSSGSYGSGSSSGSGTSTGGYGSGSTSGTGSSSTSGYGSGSSTGTGTSSAGGYGSGSSTGSSSSSGTGSSTSTGYGNRSNLSGDE